MKKRKIILAALLFAFCFVMGNTTDVAAATLKASIKTDCGSSASKGDKITLTGSSSGGTSKKKYYKFRYKKNSKMYTIRGYSTKKTTTFTPSANGTYKFYVYVKQSSKVVTKTYTVYVKTFAATISHAEIGYVNNKITITGGSAGGWNTKKYEISYTLNGTKKVISSYSSTYKKTFTPTEGGTYTLKVTAKDGKDRTVSKTASVKIIESNGEDLELRQKLVDVAVGWYGVKEGSAGHKEIIKVYNSEKNNMYANGKYSHYTASTSDSWCDIFTSACFIKAGYQVISGVECGCQRHINLLNTKLCSWVEDDSYVPQMGDIIFYDWDDSGKGDCTGWADHVGIVVSCDGKQIKVIEGNKDGSPDRVGYRTINVNGKYIRGFGVPKYVSLIED